MTTFSATGGVKHRATDALTSGAVPSKGKLVLLARESGSLDESIEESAPLEPYVAICTVEKCTEGEMAGLAVVAAGVAEGDGSLPVVRCASGSVDASGCGHCSVLCGTRPAVCGGEKASLKRRAMATLRMYVSCAQ